MISITLSTEVLEVNSQCAFGIRTRTTVVGSNDNVREFQDGGLVGFQPVDDVEPVPPLRFFKAPSNSNSDLLESLQKSLIPE